MEKRRYRRINVDVGVAVYLSEVVDFEGTVVNISEAGLCLCLDRNIVNFTDNLEVGTRLKLQGLDEYSFLGYIRADIFTCDMKVVYIKEIDNLIYLGCSLVGINEDFRDYAVNRQLEEMMAELGEIYEK